MVNNDIVHCKSLLSLCISSDYYYYFYDDNYFVSIIKLILYQPMTFSFIFLVLLPLPLVGWWAK